MEPVVHRVHLATGLTYEMLEWLPDDEACDHTVLLLHGYLDLAWGWRAMANAGLGGRYHLIAPSLRGHGASDWVGAGAMYYFFDYVADVASLVDTNSRKRLSIVGHSMGGMVGAYYTGTYPERVERLATLEGMSVPEDATGPARLRNSVSARKTTLQRRGTQAAPGGRRFKSIEEAVARMRHHDPSLDEAQARMLAEHDCVRLPSGELVFRHDPLLAPQTPIGFELEMAGRFWGRATCPVLYVDGETSTFRLSDAERNRRLALFPNALSATLPDTGHMMIRQRPVELCRVLIEFLDATPQETRG